MGKYPEACCRFNERHDDCGGMNCFCNATQDVRILCFGNYDAEQAWKVRKCSDFFAVPLGSYCINANISVTVPGEPGTDVLQSARFLRERNCVFKVEDDCVGTRLRRFLKALRPVAWNE